MKLSVLMVTYNHERFLAQALSSALAQRVNFEYEIIVGEDCSSDATREILMDFHRRHPEKIIPLLRERNLGRMRNFNETVAACRGEYLAILEGDDYWTREDKLQIQADFLDRHPDHALCCTRALFAKEGAPGNPEVQPQIPAGSYAITDLFAANPVVTCTVMYRRSAVVPLPDWSRGLKMRDWTLHVLVARSGKVRLLDEVTSTYRIHPGGAWSSLSPGEQKLAIVEMLTTMEKHLDSQCTKPIRSALAHRYLELANEARFYGSRTETARYLLNYARHGGWRLPMNRFVAGLAAYTLIGSGYRLFSRAKPASGS
jgi:glycosyltransferase involved in cell wall biosynthesis